MKTKFNFLLMVLLTAFAVSVTSCEDDLDPTTFEGAAAKYVGHTYKLTGVHWSGTAIDLDGDGTRRWDLMEGEMSRIKGFDPYRHEGSVRIYRPTSKSEINSALEFQVTLPFPVYTQKEEKWEAAYIMYLSVNPKMTFRRGGYWTSETCQIDNDKTHPFVGKIDNLVVTNLKPESFDISMVCYLVNEENELEENFLIYHYQR